MNFRNDPVFNDIKCPPLLKWWGILTGGTLASGKQAREHLKCLKKLKKPHRLV